MMFSQQNHTIIVNINEEVILNCSASSSPDPVYSWSIPDSCLSCPSTSNDSILIFFAQNITDSGEYICVAENEYGSVLQGFSLHIACKCYRELI